MSYTIFFFCLYGAQLNIVFPQLFYFSTHSDFREPPGRREVVLHGSGDRKFVVKWSGKSAKGTFELAWEGSGPDTTARDRDSGRLILRINPAFYRPAEVETLLGDPAKAREALGWVPEVSFERLVEMMVEADLERLRKGRLLM